MAEFSNIGFTNYDWDGSADYVIDEPYINLITVSGNPNSFTPASTLTLPRVLDTNPQDILGDFLLLLDYK